MMGMPDERAMADLAGAYALLAARADVRKDRIGAVGWCMGGKYSLKLAVAEPKLAAAVAYYGMPPPKAEDIAKIHAPVLGNYGAEDQGPAPDQVKAFEAAMKKAGKSVEIKLYDGAGHAFANVNNPWGGYREAAAKDAWSRTLAFFAKCLCKRTTVTCRFVSRETVASSGDTLSTAEGSCGGTGFSRPSHTCRRTLCDPCRADARRAGR